MTAWKDKHFLTLKNNTMKKEEIYVEVTNDEEKQQVIEILNKAGEKIWQYEFAMYFNNYFKYLIFTPNNDWYIASFKQERKQITIDQLTLMLLPPKSKSTEYLIERHMGAIINDIHSFVAQDAQQRGVTFKQAILERREYYLNSEMSIEEKELRIRRLEVIELTEKVKELQYK